MYGKMKNKNIYPNKTAKLNNKIPNNRINNNNYSQRYTNFSKLKNHNNP